MCDGGRLSGQLARCMKDCGPGEADGITFLFQLCVSELPVYQRE